ncbi:MAG: DUF5522 domain-containing protein [Bacteroidota bacterium]
MKGPEKQTEPIIPGIGEYYFDPDGKMVFTEKYHLRRGYCCGSGCRHCPYRKNDINDNSETGG